jgi:hypothetical protein
MSLTTCRLPSALALCCALLSALSGCGGGSSSSPLASAPQLTSITVGPSDVTVFPGATQQYTASGGYSDGSTQNLTASVTWASSATTVAAFSTSNSPGLASAVAIGTTTVSAASAGVSGSTTLTVSAPKATLVSIAVTPSNPTVTTGVTEQFSATGTYSDSTRQNLTNTVAWRSSASNVASISNVSGAAGMATTIGLGSTSISATVGRVSGSTVLTVTRDVIAPLPNGAYLGAWANPALGTQPVAIASLETVLGHRLAIHTSYWGFNGGTQLASATSNAAITDDIARGRFPLISWGCSSGQGTTFQAIANGSYDSSVVIPAALAVKALATNVFIRPSWEFNLNVNNPSGNPNGNNCYTPANLGNVSLQAAEYTAYFQHLVQVFAAQGVSNVTWVWCPAVSATDFQSIPIDTFYPGSASVDWIAGDTYDKTTQPVRGFVGIWSAFWSHYSSFGKPLMIAETGEVNNATDGFTQQKYFDDASAALQPGGAFNLNSGSRIAAFVYFDSFPASYNWTVDSPQDPNGEQAWATMAALPFFQD